MSEKIISLNIDKRDAKARGNVACVTLGCAKNQVDSEIFLGTSVAAGYKTVTDLAKADYIVVNTCGFLGDAMKESIDAILDVADLKIKGRLKKLVVAGCMVSRYGAHKLHELLPEADAFLSTDEVMFLPEVLADKDIPVVQTAFLYDHTTPRILSSGAHSAYVKIADGCNRPCAFCMIPKIKGSIRSRKADSIVEEVKALAEKGIKEVNLIGQDLTAYGVDNGEIGLAGLLKRIDGVVPWIRLLYAYPVGMTEELLSTVKELSSVCEYIDVPLQHSSESVLKRMKRPVGQFAPRRLVDWIRSKYPELHLRTTFIVGYPGETDEDFADLERFVLEGHFDSVGVFEFSPEDGVEASLLTDQVPQKVKKLRRKRLMLAQQKVLNRKYADIVGKTFDVLIDGVHEETDLLLVGRTRFQAPEVDGSIIINDADVDMQELQAGVLAKVEITECAGYDLIARVKELL